MSVRRAFIHAGMMDTVLNGRALSRTIPGMIAKTKNPRFVWDSYRRLIMMYADVVMEKAEGLEPALGKGIRKILDEKLDEAKHSKGYKSDTDLTAADLETLAGEFKALIKKHLGKPFPDDPMAQLWAASPPFSRAGTARRLSPIAGLRVFRMMGHCVTSGHGLCNMGDLLRQASLLPVIRLRR